MRVYSHDPTIRTLARTNIKWFKAVSVQSYSRVFSQRMLHSYNSKYQSTSTNTVACDGWGPLNLEPATYPNILQITTVNSSLINLKIAPWIYQQMLDSFLNMRKQDIMPWMSSTLPLLVEGSYKSNESSAAVIIEYSLDPDEQILFPIQPPANTHTI